MRGSVGIRPGVTSGICRSPVRRSGVACFLVRVSGVNPREHHVVVNALEVNAERLWDSLERSAEIGRFRDVGLRRLALSAEDKQMRDLFIDWVKAAGCTVEI